MAKKTTFAAAKTTAAKTPKATADAVVTPVRNTAVPPKSAAIASAPVAAKKLAPSYDAIALRAYFIWKSGGGNQFDNWLRAERELSV